MTFRPCIGETKALGNRVKNVGLDVGRTPGKKNGFKEKDWGRVGKPCNGGAGACCENSAKSQEDLFKKPERVNYERQKGSEEREKPTGGGGKEDI